MGEKMHIHEQLGDADTQRTRYVSASEKQCSHPRENPTTDLLSAPPRLALLQELLEGHQFHMHH